ncbi:phage major tail tube protein [Pasteurella multocida]|uniref:phage major tail tube protein n=1 Tax=Pasteurella multocida TaxID=747 RepID=UPI000BBD0EE1|nr:phage major tail tube protein [Pasteurella multocida]ATF75287.1 phage major tail tube protein [Pasteurella multocida]ATN17688.1 phage major tail tube protein [Pasteurella multocida]MDX3892977.1 phage major tail tube protein [Pasteurella multocida]BDE03400.1 phage major tail tube protein [Pasteurella multocida]BDE03576.1 phage major tail tube protein [Pasteurella multocida]
MSTAINQIVNANVYIDGNSLLGKAKEFKLPDLEFEFIEHKGLGLHGTVELPAGLNAMEGEVIWDSFYPEVRSKAYNPYKNAQLMVRSNLQVFDSRGLAAEEPLVTIMNVAFNKTTGGSLKNKEATEHSDTFKIYSIKQTLGGKEILFVDVLANIYRVNGQDVLQKYRTNIGQ